MTKVVETKDCGNSPKNLFVQTLAVAIEKGDRVGFLGRVVETLAWSYPGRPVIVGREAAADFLVTCRGQAPAEIVVEHAISHGWSGAANGTALLASGERIRFCHVFDFASAKGDRAARITSFYADDSK